MPDHACDRGAARLDPCASRSQAYQPDEYETGSASRLRLRMGALAHVHLWPVSRRGGLRRGTPVTGSRLVSRPVLHDAAVGAAGAGAAGAGAVTAWHLRGGPVRAPTGEIG